MTARYLVIKHFLRSACVGITVALIVLVIGVSAQVAWAISTSATTHQSGVSVPMLPHVTSASDRSTTISESYTDFTWVSFAPSLTLGVSGLMVGFRWAYRRGQAGAAP
jgi:heme/copper-type cytochrome/quinol oxidase subunit 2